MKDFGVYYYPPRKKRKFIHELLVSWDKTLCEYEVAWPSTLPPYVYGEEANRGLLAVAAAKIGAFPFEEFSVTKRRGRKELTGFGDLEILTRNGQLWHVEATIRQLKFDRSDLINEIREGLDEAVSEVRELVEGSKLRMGIVFVSPNHVSDHKRDCEKFVEQIMNAKRLNADFFAYHFVSPNKYSKSEFSDWPGISIVGRYAFL